MQIKNVFKRELYAYFSTPVAYIFLVFFLIMTGWFTFAEGWGNFYEKRQAHLDPFFNFHNLTYLIFIPAVAMRAWSEERRSGTVQLLLTLPITVPQAVIGKFLAYWIFLGIALLLTFPIVITVFYLGDPDVGVIISSYLGSFLLAGTFLSIGCFTSALTKNQVISFILSMAICLLFSLTEFSMIRSYLNSLPVSLADAITALSFFEHFNALKKGLISFSDVFYFVAMMVFWVYSTIVVIESKKSA